MSSRLYYADVSVGDKVLSKVEVSFRNGDGVRVIPEGAKALVRELDNLDALVVFEEVPDVLLRLGRYELRRVR